MPSSAPLTLLFPLSLHDALPISSDQAKPSGLVWVPPGGEARFLAPLPVRKIPGIGEVTERALRALGLETVEQLGNGLRRLAEPTRDRKSTRLNSSHTVISYAVFCSSHAAVPSFPTRRSSDLFRPSQAKRPRVGSARRRSPFPSAAPGAKDSWHRRSHRESPARAGIGNRRAARKRASPPGGTHTRSEEHTSELQSHSDLVCRLLLLSRCCSLFPYTTLFRSLPTKPSQAASCGFRQAAKPVS